MSLLPKERVKVSVPKALITYIVGQNRNLSYTQVLDIIQVMLKEIYENVVMEVGLWIDEKVPKRTGRLRLSLKDNLKASGIVGTILRFILGTTVPYAPQVNQMPTSRVRHTGQIGYVYYWNPFGIRGRIILWDPRAIGNFWDRLLEFAKERISINIAKVKAKYATSTAITTRQMSKIKVSS